jgi:hypothetical protein
MAGVADDGLAMTAPAPETAGPAFGRPGPSPAEQGARIKQDGVFAPRTIALDDQTLSELGRHVLACDAETAGVRHGVTETGGGRKRAGRRREGRGTSPPCRHDRPTRIGRPDRWRADAAGRILSVSDACPSLLGAPTRPGCDSARSKAASKCSLFVSVIDSLFESGLCADRKPCSRPWARVADPRKRGNDDPTSVGAPRLAFPGQSKWAGS